MIHVKNLTFTYAQADAPAIKGLNFDIQNGEVFGFLGPSGAGKSTTQKILIRLLRNYVGDVSVFDNDLSAWSSDYYERIGVSFEYPNHYLKLTALENLVYFGSLYGGHKLAPETLLDILGLAEDARVPVAQFSKGMKTRLGVARALLHDPELLFMDEPTAGLDPVNARRIKNLIKEQQHKGKTVFLTTHDMTVADELCDRVGFIVEGELALVDSPRALKLQHGKHSVRVEYDGTKNKTAAQEFPLDGLGSNPDFLKLLGEHEIQTIHSLEASLEDIFIEVTGKSLS
jgi:fluoroquinolone transport system ATP-binding protein